MAKLIEIPGMGWYTNKSGMEELKKLYPSKHKSEPTIHGLRINVIGDDMYKSLLQAEQEQIKRNKEKAENDCY